jgi:hypothetical protein
VPIVIFSYRASNRLFGSPNRSEDVPDQALVGTD